MKFRYMTFAASLFTIGVCWAQIGPATGASTQEINAQNANNVCRIYFSTIKPGMAQQYEAGRKKHMQFHRTQKDTWAWRTYVIETGENSGSYVSSACNHSWKDFDDWEQRMGKADTADGEVNMAPYVASQRNRFYIYRSDMSLAPANDPPAAMTSVTIYVLHPGAAPDFTAAIKKINDVLSKANWPKTSGWLQLANGGEGPTFVLLTQRKNWADFAPPSKTPMDLVTEALGKDGADQIFKTIRDSTEHLYTEAATYRPDLSYEPAR